MTTDSTRERTARIGRNHRTNFLSGSECQMQSSVGPTHPDQFTCQRFVAIEFVVISLRLTLEINRSQSSPDPLDAIKIKKFVAADDRDPFYQRLSNDQTIKRVAVMKV